MIREHKKVGKEQGDESGRVEYQYVLPLKVNETSLNLMCD